MTEEIWRDIDGYEGLYQVSNFGRVRSFHKNGRILKPRFNTCGYPRVALCRSNKVVYKSIHRLVAEAFIPNPDGKHEVNHKDGNKANNHVENLERVTHAENIRHAYATGLIMRPRGEDHPEAKLTNEQVIYIRDNPDGLSIKQLAKTFGVVDVAISQIQLGKTYKTAGGTIRTGKPPALKHVPDNIREQIRAEYIPGKYGHGCHALAKKFGVHSVTIWKIVHETN